MTAKFMAFTILLYSVAAYALTFTHPNDLMFLLISGDKRVAEGRILASLLVITLVINRRFRSSVSQPTLSAIGVGAIFTGLIGFYLGSTYYTDYSYFFPPLDYATVFVVGYLLVVLALEQTAPQSAPATSKLDLLFDTLVSRALALAQNSLEYISTGFDALSQSLYIGPLGTLQPVNARNKHPP